jgi:hypothetical protein
MSDTGGNPGNIDAIKHIKGRKPESLSAEKALLPGRRKSRRGHKRGRKLA